MGGTKEKEKELELNKVTRVWMFLLYQLSCFLDDQFLQKELMDHYEFWHSDRHIGNQDYCF